MCIICVDFNKNRLTIDEAFINLDEMEESISEEHYDEVIEMLNRAIDFEAQQETYREDADLDEDDVYNKIENEDVEDWRTDNSYTEYED